MDVKNARRIYRNNPVQALVSDELITASDEEINAAIEDATPGMIIYNAGMSIVKQKGLDGSWLTIVNGTATNTSNGTASSEEVNIMLDGVFGNK